MNNMLRYIEGYVQKLNPGNAPIVVGQLLDDECPKDFIKWLILSVLSLLPVELLVAKCEKRNRLRFLTQFLEHLVSKGSQDVHVHNALGKIIIDSEDNVMMNLLMLTNKNSLFKLQARSWLSVEEMVVYYGKIDICEIDKMVVDMDGRTVGINLIRRNMRTWLGNGITP